jgi:uncharacterized membrane protein YdjX (TVP38/TMEM64 family)
MNRPLPPLLILVLVLGIPLIPLLIFGERLDHIVEGWLQNKPSPGSLALMAVGVLAADIFLPVPSSVVNTAAGKELGLMAGAGASWLGLSLGGVIGFVLARKFGRPWLEHYCRPNDLAWLDQGFGKLGLPLLALLRPAPLFAEASVLLAGAAKMPWAGFLWSILPANAVLAVVYAALGHYAAQGYGYVYLLFATGLVPLAATLLLRRYFVNATNQNTERSIP